VETASETSITPPGAEPAGEEPKSLDQALAKLAPWVKEEVHQMVQEDPSIAPQTKGLKKIAEQVESALLEGRRAAQEGRKPEEIHVQTLQLRELAEGAYENEIRREGKDPEKLELERELEKAKAMEQISEMMFGLIGMGKDKSKQTGLLGQKPEEKEHQSFLGSLLGLNAAATEKNSPEKNDQFEGLLEGLNLSKLIGPGSNMDMPEPSTKGLVNVPTISKGFGIGEMAAFSKK